MTSVAKEAFIEFLGMTLFVWVGVGAAVSDYSMFGVTDVVGVAFAFGFGITAVAYATCHHNSGQLNPAVTWGLFLAGIKTGKQLALNLCAQMLGAVFAVSLVAAQSGAVDSTLGTNAVNSVLGPGNALIGETVGTFLLMYVVLETAVSPHSIGNSNDPNESGKIHSGGLAIAPIPIGIAVFLAHLVLIPIDGCSINPARSFGSSFISMIDGNDVAFKDHWVFWLGPILGATLASLIWRYVVHTELQKGPASDEIIADVELGIGATKTT